jgi:hypothetical protein
MRENRDLVQATAYLDSWLETMRNTDGYSGPVVHWWQNCLMFTGVGLDWRYEGIIAAYLALHRKTSEQRWLDKARRAGNDLLHGQLANSSFKNSQFELNPYSHGTPHEAACDKVLLELADTLGTEGEPYRFAALRNLQEFHVARLWDADAQMFYDDKSKRIFVPNKASTLTEALFATGDNALIENYALPTLDAVVRHQQRSGACRGGIAQYSTRNKHQKWYFPYYAARCVPALITGYHWSKQQGYLDAAHEVIQFICRWVDSDGGLPQVVYEDGRTNRYPCWIAGAADIVRAARLFNEALSSTFEWIMRWQQPTGAFPSACGFASQASQRAPDKLPEFRDVLPVCGWNDKTLRLLADLLGQDSVIPKVEAVAVYETECTAGGTRMIYHEDNSVIELRHHTTPVYRWHKGATWAEVCDTRWLWK